MKCDKCGAILVYLGATIGGTQLYGCPHCHRVYYKPTEVKKQDE